MSQAFSNYDNQIIEVLNLRTWRKVRTFCDGIKSRGEQYFHKNISAAIQNLLKPFEALNNVSSQRGLLSSKRHTLLNECIQSTDSAKTYGQLIKEQQSFINNELNKISLNHHDDLLLVSHLKQLQNFLFSFELLYKLITREAKRPTKTRDRILLTPTAFYNTALIRSERYNYSKIPDDLLWKEIQNSQSQ